MLRAVAGAASAHRIQLKPLEIRDPARLSVAAADASNGGSGGLFALGSPALYRHSLTLAQLAPRQHLPTSPGSQAGGPDSQRC
jgi:hypothetical protein